MMTFEDISVGYYHALTAGLGLSGSGVQLVQPVPLPTDDASLWAFLDQLPPASLYRDRDEGAATGSFFRTYAAILASLQIPARDQFLQVVGPDVADAFSRFLATRPDPLPALSTYPATFRNWALLRHPAVALQGTTALAGMLLEPLGAASAALLGYADQTAPHPRPGRRPDWDQTYAELVTNLVSSPSRELSVTTASLITDPTGTWAEGAVGAARGLWGSSGPASHQAQTFATSDFQLRMSLGHVLLFRPVPGPWYSSAALGIALSSPRTPPWAPGSPLDWNAAFGTDGRLRLLTGSLIIAEDLDLTIDSAGPYTEDDQQTIRSGQASGLWPLYLTDGAETSCSFSPGGALTLRISTAPEVPVLLGMITMPLDRYLGHNATA